MDLSKEIEMMKKSLTDLANTKKEPLKDPQIYELSCAIDKKIVEFIKSAKRIS